MKIPFILGAAVSLSAQALDPSLRGSISFLHQNQHSIRQLLDQTSPRPERSCGHIISDTNVSTINEAVNLLLGALLSPGSPFAAFSPVATPLVTSAVQYGVRASVLCGSCDEIRELYEGHGFLGDDTGSNGFLSYCDEGRFGSNATHSGLLLIPLDNDTGEPLMGSLKGHLKMPTTRIGPQNTPSETYPPDLLSKVAALETDLFSTLSMYSNLLPGILAAASGAVSIIPDYIGFGQSYKHGRSYLVKAPYQQAASLLWLKASKQISFDTCECTSLEQIVTVTGYSEGGYAGYTAVQSLQSLGVNVLSAILGGSPFRLDTQIRFVIESIMSGDYDEYLNVLLPIAGYSYSSTNPDLPNTGLSQDFLSQTFLNPANFSRNIKEWLFTSQNFSTLNELIPSNDPLSILNPSVIQLISNAEAQGVDSLCEAAEVGKTDALCQALEENTIVNDVEATTIPVTVCHSTNDAIVTSENLPDLNTNPLLTNYLLPVLNIPPAFDHFTTAKLCLFGEILPFTRSNNEPDANSHGPLGDPDGCMIDPTSSPSRAPTNEPSAVSTNQLTDATMDSQTSLGFRASISWTLLLAGLGFYVP